MKLTVRRLDDVVVLGFEGELTMMTAVECLRDARRALASAPSPLVALDMARVRRLDASGCAAIIALRRDVQGRRGNLCLFGLGAEVRLLLEIMQVHLILDMVPDLDGAFEALGRRPGASGPASATTHWGLGSGEQIERRAAG